MSAYASSPEQVFRPVGRSARAQGVDGQPVFDVVAQSLVKRHGSADCDHHRRRLAVQSEDADIQQCSAVLFMDQR